MSRKIELTKISAERAHQLFQTLKKLGLLEHCSWHNTIDDVYNAWRYAEAYEQKKQTSSRTPK